MPSHWAVIETLVHEIGALSADVQTAELTLATDPRTSAARRALDAATAAVCTALDDNRASAAADAAEAIAEAREALVELGVASQTPRELTTATRALMRRLEDDMLRAADLRRRLAERRGDRG
ncbi:MAG TPA: hypothetical protein VMR21_02835 [Vicinamibacteria bacterium]|nr:hypothetical protein [Vicinamibacteria bacterium]